MQNSEASHKNWLRFLAAWSLFTSVAVVSLIITVLTLVLPASDPNPLGETYFEFMAAAHNPSVHHLAILFDVAAWMGWGGLFVAFAMLLYKAAPVRSVLVGLLATGMSIGFFGACLRIVGTPQLAADYLAAESIQQTAILLSYDNLLQVINVSFSAGGLLAGIALILIASAGRQLHVLSRWIVTLLGIGGGVHVGKAVLELVFGLDLGPLALLGNSLLVVALVATAVKIYRQPVSGTNK